MPTRTFGQLRCPDSLCESVRPGPPFQIGEPGLFCLTDGLSEELLNLLVHVDELRVASRTSSFAYRGSTLGIPEISQALNVGHILEGSVRKDGDRIRITAQLIESASDRHLWSDNFDRELVDIFTIQDEIANAIVLALTGELGMNDGKLVTVESVTENFDACEMYLTARELFINREQLPESIRLFRKAVELDPDFARAWEGLAAAESVAEAWIFDDDIDHYPLAKEAAEKALSLNPDLSMPLAVLGNLASVLPGDLVSSMKYYDDAIQKDPKNTSALLWRGLELRNAGFFDEAMESFRQCLAIDPGYLNCKHHVAITYLSLGDTDTALKHYNELLESLFYTTPHVFVSAYVRSGNQELALVLADKASGNDGAPVVEWIRAIENPEDDHSVGLARLKDWERRTNTGIQLTKIPQALMTFGAYDDYVSDAGEGALWHPDGDEFRKTPRFKELIRVSGVFDYWQKRGFPAHCQPVGDDDFECGRP